MTSMAVEYKILIKSAQSKDFLSLKLNVSVTSIAAVSYITVVHNVPLAGHFRPVTSRGVAREDQQQERLFQSHLQ